MLAGLYAMLIVYMDIHIAILIGTTRAQRKSAHVARFLQQKFNEQPNVTTQLVDPIEFNFNGDGNDPEAKDPRYTAITQQADGFMIVVPEYNHSFPGSLKRMLDSELATYNHKAVVFAGVSSGAWGGVRAIESLINAVRETGLVTIAYDMQFPNVQDLFDEQGTLLNPDYNNYIKATVDEFLWMSRVLKQARQQNSTLV